MPRLTLLSIVLALSIVPVSTQKATGRSDAPKMTVTSAAQLRADMRKLWTDHVVWTRDYIIAAVGDQPDATAAANRLMKNQEDIGAAMGKFYGAPAGQQLTTLLKSHISIAVDLIKAAKASDSKASAAADKQWQDNAVAIADFLSKANPNWSRGTLVAMMQKHLLSTTNEVTARVTKNWAEDVRTFDAVYDHILTMADALTDGIVKQFPDKGVLIAGFAYYLSKLRTAH